MPPYGLADKNYFFRMIVAYYALASITMSRPRVLQNDFT